MFALLKVFKLCRSRSHGVAHFLDPRYKDTLVDDPANFRTVVSEWIASFVPSAEVDVDLLVDLAVAPPPAKRSFLGDIGRKYARNSPMTSGTSTSQPAARVDDVEREFSIYVREGTEDWDSDLIKYWKANEYRFPLLAPVARRFLGAPATSVHSEQVFSTAKLVYDPLRSRLDPRKADMLVFLNRNLPTIGHRY